VYLLLDFQNGGELFFHLQKQRKFREDIVKFYAAQLYIAFEYLHSKNILYRDIKPENIILTHEGHLQLIDFGLAKCNINHNNLTSTFCGTNEYIRIN
jgi:serine/threonine protein kinase